MSIYDRGKIYSCDSESLQFIRRQSWERTIFTVNVGFRVEIGRYKFARQGPGLVVVVWDGVSVEDLVSDLKEF